MSRWERYPAYKESGIEWIGEIPAHWEVRRFRHLFKFSKGLNITKENLQDVGIPCVNYGEIHSKYGFEIDPQRHSLKYVDVKYLQENPQALLKRGDFVFADTSEDIDGAGNFTHLDSDIATFAGYHTIIARYNGKIKADIRYLAYLLDSEAFRTQIRKRVKGVKVYSITNAILKDTLVWIPPLPEQKAITEFLDKKTEQIDRAIAAKERLIKLLKERRQILIHRAVTRGLDPNAPTKDSGIEWIGEIPVHWEIEKLLGLSNFIRGNSSFGKDELLSNGKYVALQYGKTYKVNVIDETYQFYVNDEFYRKSQIVKYGDTIFISTSETIEDLGHSAYYNRKDIGLLGGEQILLSPKKDAIDGKYLYFSSKVFSKELKKFATGIKVFRFNINDLKTIYIPLPTKQEQDKIVKYIDEKTTKTDKAIQLQQNYIEQLKAYKQILIDSVVTGKVRIV